MKKKVIIVLAVSLAVLAMFIGGCSSNVPSGATITGGFFSNQSTGIWVSGTGKVTATPDTAILSLGVQVQDRTVSQAQSQASDSMNAVVNALKARGVAEKDIQTQAFSIQQQTRYDNNTQQQVIIGYIVTNTVTAKIRKIADAGSIIDAVASAGGDYTRINNISFTIDDPTSYVTQARKLAMTDAKDKAQQLADQSGVKLKNPTYIVEIGGSVPIKSEGGVVPPSAPSQSPTPVSPGEMDITLTVQAACAID